ncbi:hypothetical protein [Allosphingosinicella sp.]|jgi:uncharacterized integral membrane protein|uniref:hypothetical protein n=1 Tax=Allosphingosinicella sp. TaxID=2823234 RepID=UPI002EF09E24
MQFLKTLFWVILAIVLVLFAGKNWHPVTIELWGGLLADVKLPLLVLVAFLAGFLPTFFVYRARVWALKRRLETVQPAVVGNTPVGIAPRETPLPEADRSEEERIATDSKAWPA